MTKEINIAQVGSGFISQVHFDSFKLIEGANVKALCDVDDKRGKQFCKDNKIDTFYRDFNDVLKDNSINVVSLGVPNYLHAPLAIKAANAGKHIICEKPLALTLEDADAMIAAADLNGVLIGYAEELCYVPKNVRMKEICDTGGIGDVFLSKQQEKHGGPYSPWFWEGKKAGGGILMDMGCHSLEFCRWFSGKKEVKSVYAEMATYVHKDKTNLEDHVLLSMEYEDGTSSIIESAWTLQGGMISKAEAHGTEGVIYTDLLQGSGVRAYSQKGYLPDSSLTPPALRSLNNRKLLADPADSAGWSYPEWDWLYNNGYPQEMKDFLDCMRFGGRPVETAVDGRIVLEIMLAGYWSAGTGQRVKLPFEPVGYKFPADLWLHPEDYKF